MEKGIDENSMNKIQDGFKVNELKSGLIVEKYS